MNRFRKPRHPQLIPCPSCGQALEPTAMIQPEGLCLDCCRKAWEVHQHYRQGKAMLIAEAIPCVWTEDLFGSELILERDGCYLQTVRWNHLSMPHRAEQIACFEAQVWHSIWDEAHALFQCYEASNCQMEDVETQSIWLRIEGELVEMRSQQSWQDQSSAHQFRTFWNQIHSKSPWLDRLKLT